MEPGDSGMLEYTLPSSVEKREYQLRCKVCTLHRAQEKDSFCFGVNGDIVGEVAIGYTVGKWSYTSAFAVEVGGDDVLTITRKSESGNFQGVTIREIVLD